MKSGTISTAWSIPDWDQLCFFFFVFLCHKNLVKFLWCDVSSWVTWATGEQPACQGSLQFACRKGQWADIYADFYAPWYLQESTTLQSAFFCWVFSLYLFVLLSAFFFILSWFVSLFLLLCSVRTFSGCQNLCGTVAIATDHACVSLLLPSLSFYFALRRFHCTRKRFAEASRWLRWRQCWSFLRKRMRFSLNSGAPKGSSNPPTLQLVLKMLIRRKMWKQEIKNSSPWSITGAGVVITFLAKLVCFK